MKTYNGIPVVNDIELAGNEEYKDIKCKTILPASEREDDDDFWTQMYIEQYGNFD